MQTGFRISGRYDQYLNTKPFELDDDSEDLVNDTVESIRSKFDVDIQVNSGESNKQDYDVSYGVYISQGNIENDWWKYPRNNGVPESDSGPEQRTFDSEEGVDKTLEESDDVSKCPECGSTEFVREEWPHEELICEACGLVIYSEG